MRANAVESVKLAIDIKEGDVLIVYASGHALPRR